MMRRSIAIAACVLLALGLLPSRSVAQDEPVRYRLGGSEEDFTEKYGRPIETVALSEHDGTVQTYEIFGFQSVSATVFDGRVIKLVLRAVAGDTWTEEAARTVIGDFGPTDAEYDDEFLPLGPTDAGDRLGIQGRSEALADSVDEDTYDRFEAEGEPGDFFVTLYGTGGSQYTSLSLDLGIAAEADASDGAVDEERAASPFVTVSGIGTVVSDKFDLPAGRYRVQATVGIATAYGSDGFAIFFYPVSGDEELLFNEVIVQPGTWTGSAILENPRAGLVFVAAENTKSAWTLVFEPF